MTPETLTQLTLLHRAGLPMREIARTLGICLRTIQMHRKALGLPRRPNGRKKFRK